MRTRGVALAAVLALTGAGCGKTSAAPPLVQWHDLASGEVLARREHKPVLIFAFAEWSVADKELDEVTFRSPAVRGEMQDFIAIRIDCTDDELPQTQREQNRFKVIGVPTLLALRSLDDYPDPPAWKAESPALFRINEFVPPQRLVPALQAAKKQFQTL